MEQDGHQVPVVPMEIEQPLNAIDISHCTETTYIDQIIDEAFIGVACGNTNII
jgi:hypothetical protein